MVVFGKWAHLPLRTICNELIAHGITDENNSQVPIVKLKDLKTQVQVDISFNTSNGVQSAKLVKQYLSDYPLLKYLILVLKQFLYQRELNEVFTGGVGSYALMLMLVSFIQLHPRKDASDPNANLGVLLMEFLDLYGRRFNYMKTGIRLADGGSYVPKEEFFPNASVLSIEDPLTGHDVSRGSYMVGMVQQAFQFAYQSLSKLLLPSYSLYDEQNPSVLYSIISISDETQQYRNWVSKTFKVAVPNNHSSSVASLSPLQKSKKAKRDSDVIELDAHSTTNTPPSKSAIVDLTTDGKIPHTTHATDDSVSVSQGKNDSAQVKTPKPVAKVKPTAQVTNESEAFPNQSAASGKKFNQSAASGKKFNQSAKTPTPRRGWSRNRRYRWSYPQMYPPQAMVANNQQYGGGFNIMGSPFNSQQQFAFDPSRFRWHRNDRRSANNPYHQAMKPSKSFVSYR